MAIFAALLIALVLAITVRRERRARRRFQILGDIAAVSDAGGSLEETFDAICAILVPEFADFCMIDVIDEDRVPPGPPFGSRPAAGRSSSRGSPNGCPRPRSRWSTAAAVLARAALL